jgi:hypothetical protein
MERRVVVIPATVDISSSVSVTVGPGELPLTVQQVHQDLAHISAKR